MNISFEVFRLTYNFLARTPLRYVPGMLRLSNAIFRQVWQGGNVIHVQGNKMFIDVADSSPALRITFQAYAMNLVHEEVTTKLFRKIVRKGDTVLDLGANIGYFTLMAARAVGVEGKVYSFEPEPKNFEYLKKNIEVNEFAQATANQKAVSDQNGTTRLYICAYDSGHHTINKYDGIEAIARGRPFAKTAIDIETVRVDDFLSEHGVGRVDVIKMDVEGAEALVLNGMRETLLNNDVKVFLEFFPILMTKMGSDPKLYIESLLNDFGFDVYAIGHDYDLGDQCEDLLKIDSYDQLASMLHETDAHMNLLLSKTPIDL